MIVRDAIGRPQRRPAARPLFITARRAGGAAVAATGITAVLLSIGVTQFVSRPQHSSHNGSGVAAARQPVTSHSSRPVRAVLPTRPSSYLGTYEAASPGSYRQVLQFGQTIGQEPNIALYFSGLDDPFQTTFADAAMAHDAIPAVQIDPVIAGAPVSLAALAAGRFDPLLREYAHEVASFGHPVIIGFAHEPNGWWYAWGENHVKPAVWIAAWRHVVDVFRHEGANNVTWLWTMNLESSSTLPISDWWPGAAYVTWIGLDGYYGNSQDTFGSIFGSAIDNIRGVSKAPILIAETAVDTSLEEPRQIRNLFSAIREYNCLGFVWFDKDTPRAAWRLEGNQTAIRVFRHEAAGWQLERFG